MSKKELLIEVMKSYADCNSYIKGRNLDYRASEAVNSDDLIEIINKAIPDGYNNFNSQSLNQIASIFGIKAQYWIARENSPCLYVKPDPTKIVWFNRPRIGVEELGADEMTLQPDGTIRLWWD
jgi:hypothetical protein